MKIYKAIWSGRNYVEQGIGKFPAAPIYHRNLLKRAADMLTKRECKICGGNIVQDKCDFCGESTKT